MVSWREPIRLVETVKMQKPNFTHAELMQLWHAISQYVDNTDEEIYDTSIAREARSKLDDYVLAVTSEPTQMYADEDMFPPGA